MPAESYGAAVGLQVGDIVSAVGKCSVPYYKSVAKCMLIVENAVKISEESPVTLTVRRGAPRYRPVAEPRSEISTIAGVGSNIPVGDILEGAVDLMGVAVMGAASALGEMAD